MLIFFYYYLLSPEQAARFSDGQIDIDETMSRWFLIWKSSCPISFKWVEIAIQYPPENPIKIYPSPNHRYVVMLP